LVRRKRRTSWRAQTAVLRSGLFYLREGKDRRETSGKKRKKGCVKVYKKKNV